MGVCKWYNASGKKKAMLYNYGNILSKNGKAYTYGDGVWKDLLTAYDGQTISCDAQGNPTSYLGHTLTWEKGRQLKSFDGSVYVYDTNDIRVSKTINGVIHHYILDGITILRESWDNNILIPLYDNECCVCGVTYNNEPYYFIKNLQGDVVAITNVQGEVEVRYTYDAWGKPEIKFDASDCKIGTINPYRYRCYYYDEESGLYYLQCRYYDPNTARFISSDEGLTITVLKNILNQNIFIYCHNNPINEVDYFGYLSFWKRAYYLAHGIFLITTGLLSIIAAIKKGVVAAALGSFTANLLAGFVGTALGLMPLGQYWGTIIAITMIISLLWHLKSMLYNIPAGLAEIKKALS